MLFLVGPQILECISRKVSAENFDGHSSTHKEKSKKEKKQQMTTSDRAKYYEKLGDVYSHMCLYIYLYIHIHIHFCAYAHMCTYI
jgi:hypothetical protein